MHEYKLSQSIICFFFETINVKETNIFCHFSFSKTVVYWSFFASSRASSHLLFNVFLLTTKVILFFFSASLIADKSSESNVSYSFWNCSYFWVTTAIFSVYLPFFIRNVFLLPISFLDFQTFVLLLMC